MSRKTYAIGSPRDFMAVEKKILNDLVKGRLTYFALIVADPMGLNSCFFAPATKTKESRGMVFAGDYEKIVRLLLSHPQVRHIEYDPQEPAITAVFEDPYADEDLDKYDEYYGEPEEKRAREVRKK